VKWVVVKEMIENIDKLCVNWYDLNTPPPMGGGANMKTTDVQSRLKNVEGHIRGIQRMVDQDVYCIDIIRQIQAVQAALNKISSTMLENHLNSCLITAVRGDDPEEQERVLREISEVFEAASKT
jgi:CsoR family transcriptional regulator, copper-sensing transcriptional repressor